MDNMDIRFGRKNGSYDFNKTDNGVHRSAFGNNAAADSIFKKFDKDHNNILDAQELAEAKATIKEAAEKHKATNMGKREAANFLGEDYKGKNAQKDILEFLNTIGSSADTVESAYTDKNGNTSVTYNHDDAQEFQLTENYIKNGENSVLNSKIYTNDDESTLTETYAQDGKTLETKTLTKGSVTIDFDPENPDKPIRQTTDKGAGGTEIIEYEYKADNTVVETTKTNDKLTSIDVKDANGNVIKSTQYTYEGNKTTITQKQDNQEVIIVEQNGKQISATRNKYGENGKKLSQEKQVGERSYSVEYDGEGNTPIIVQNNETIDDIAKKFDCKKEDLINANKDLVQGNEKNPKFAVGQEIKIPKEVEADNKALQNRKTAQDAIAEHARDEQIRIQKEARAEAVKMEREAKARAKEAQCRELGLKDHKGAGQEVIAHTKTQQGIKLKKIGNASNGRSICEGQGGRLFVVAHDGSILKLNYVKGTEAYNKGEKVQAKAKNKDGNLINVKCAVIEKNYDKHGRSVVVDAKGKYYIMAHDGTLLNNEYVQRSNKADAMKGNMQTARTETMSMLSAQLDAAQKSFDQQMKEDGWAGDVADGISVLWGSKNRASEVRKDLAEYNNTIKELKNCKTDAEYKTTFRQKFGVEYDSEAVANYLMRPTAQNYRKAFGTKQSIGERIAKYNESQQVGAGVVKTTTKVAGAIALTAATVATGGAAGVAAGMAVAAGSAVAADVVVDVTDRVSSEEGLKDGELTEIMKEAAVDGVIAGATFGVGKALGAGYKAYKGAKIASETAKTAEQATVNIAQQAVNSSERGIVIAEKGVEKVSSQTETALAKAEKKTFEKGITNEKAAETVTNNPKASTVVSKELTGTEEAVADAIADAAVGMGAEYAENGEVTLEGTLTNMAVGSVGLAGARIGNKIKGKIHKSNTGNTNSTGDVHRPNNPNGPSDGSGVGGGQNNINSQKALDRPKSVKTNDNTDNGSRTNNTDNSTHNTQDTSKTNTDNKAHNSQESNSTNTENKANNSQDSNKTNTDNKTNNSQDSGKTNTDNKAHNSENTQQTKENQSRNNVADDDVHVMSEQEVKQAIDELEPKLQEAQVANDLKEQFTEFLDDDEINILEIRDAVRKMILKSHPDKGGSNELFNAVNNLKTAKNPAEIRQAKSNLKALLDEKSSKLADYKEQMEVLRPETQPA